MPRYRYEEQTLPKRVGWYIPKKKIQEEELAKLVKLRDATIEKNDNSEDAVNFRNKVNSAISFVDEGDWVTAAGEIGDAIELAQKLVKSGR